VTGEGFLIVVGNTSRDYGSKILPDGTQRGQYCVV